MENGNTGRVTLEDVRKHLDATSTDPRQTNSGAVRRAIGRGSMGTIQKYLESLRLELNPPQPLPEGSTPATPRPLADAVWEAAWTASQALTSHALAKALLERDGAREQVQSLTADLAAAGDDADNAVNAVAAATAAAAATATEAETATEAAESLRTQLADTIESTTAAAAAAASAAEAALATVTSDAAASAAAAEKDVAAAGAAIRADYELKIARQDTKIETLNGVIDRLGAQLAEAKSLLHRDAQPHKESKK